MTASSPIEVQTSGWTFVQIPIDLLNDSGVTDEAFRLFCKLATFANKEKRAWPSEETLAAEMNLSVRSIRNRIANLVKAGWLTRIRRKQASAVYLLESLPDRKNIAGLSEDRQEIADHKNEDRQEVAHLGNQDRQNLSIEDGAKTGKILPPNDSNTTITNQALNDNQIKDSGAQPAAPIVVQPPTPAQPETTPKSKRARASKPKEEKQKAPRQPDPAFDVIAERLFNAPPGSPALKDKNLCARIGMVKSALHNAEIVIGQFVNACVWYRQTTGLSLPRDPGKVVTMVLDYQASHKADEDVIYANGMTRAQAKAASAETVAAYQGEDQAARAVMEAIMNGTYQPQGANS